MNVQGFALDWDWNPVIFFVLLAVSLVLAARVLEKWQVAWVLPALVLYAGLDWALPVSWLFKLVFWLAVVIAVLTAILPGRSRLTMLPLTMMSVLLALIIVVCGIDYTLDELNGDGKEPKPSEKPAATQTVEVPVGPTAEEIAEELAKELKKKGFKPGEYTVEPDWEKHIVERESGFTDQTLKTNEDVKNFLNGSSDGSKLARETVLAALPETEHQRALSGVGYVPVQFFPAVQYGGNLYTDGDKIITPDGLRQAKPGDVIWVFFDEDGKIVWNASIRADCGNPEFDTIIPVRPDTPQVPPVTCVTNCQPLPPTPCVEIPNNGQLECQPKDPGKEPAQQGNVPSQVTGQAPGVGSEPASSPSASPSATYTPPAPAEPKPTRDPTTIPSPEPSTPPSSSPEPSPTQDPCVVNPDWCG